ncbi:proteoglycan 4-like [Solanum pennellii]|uniref:Proteoglycan 4-like n=1 Tax=Solanum pennellii TaxID=28526 RepID=A0ABM1V8P3_SOLPN|nr:proteoglycan 4-like [Solanum pennellii]XP_027772111.1 proteoglycan 4-like [Solanum pennellii]XP_027772112.1 proteoglycan 4-like [Solanum pennellii]
MLEASSNMDPPRNEGDMKPTNLEEVKEEGPLFSCNLFDAEMVRKVAQEFLTGLASACVDNTTGGLFKSPASMAVDIRREMVDYLIQRSETFVAESVVLEGGTETIVSDNPYDNISDFIDDFGQSKRNFFSKVSGWLLSERREDRIDDFVQEMEINGFWLMARRETVAQTVIRNVDFKNTFHCNMKFKSEEELARHVISCGFREIHCENEGCNARFSAAQHEQHDSECPFKILQCEQKCPEMLMRREMDRHCITICTMKLVNCSFYPVGCQSTVPQCKADEHRKENLQSHLVYILKLIYKEASSEALKKRAQQLEQATSGGRLAAARDARSLTTAIKNINAKLGPLEVEKKIEVNPELTEQKGEGTDVSNKNEKSPDSPKTQHDLAPTPSKVESPTKSVDVVEPTSKAQVQEDSIDISSNKHRSTEPPVKNVLSPTALNEESSKSPEDVTTSSSKSEESTLSPMKHKDSSSPEIDTHETKESTPSPKKQHDSTASSPKMSTHEPNPSPKQHHDSTASSPKMSTHDPNPSPKKHHDSTASSPKIHDSTPSPKKHHESTTSSPKTGKHESTPPKKHHECASSSPKTGTHESTTSPMKHHDSTTSSPKMVTHESTPSPKKHHDSTTSSPKVSTHEST